MYIRRDGVYLPIADGTTTVISPQEVVVSSSRQIRSQEISILG